jgi:type II secretory ATPase GspE/PulE/Tfp pilus assembly ATPase PilB-like protein
VFSTIHTNTASGAIPRLIDMGVDPFLIAPTLIGVVGQRLVQLMCPNPAARSGFPISDSLKVLLDKEFADLPPAALKDMPPFTEFYHAVPTEDCPEGTRGRTAVYEILHVDKRLEDVVLKNPIEENIYGAARASGMLTMREDAIAKALKGVIPFEEINTLGGELFPESENDAPSVDATV